MSKKNLQKVEPTQVNVLALGAGVQSSTLAFLLATKELNLEIEFYTFNIDDGLSTLQKLIGMDRFDHVFALSIWAHCD